MQDQLLDMLMKEDEITWQTIIYDLIKSEQMDPWNVDISLLTKKYLETIRKLQELNFFVSGKVVLASSLLLRIKSHKLLTEDITALDSLLYPSEDEHEELDESGYKRGRDVDIPSLAMKSPQARKRKISVNDLIGALQKALEVNKRKILRRREYTNVNIKIPDRKIDITNLIKNLYERILSFFKTKETILFDDLVNSEKSEDKILTLMPLLHLDHQRKVHIDQKVPFGNIEITKFKH
ncbi:MAG: segregation/condensation protein A [Candidatus Nanoarchaeia archaeon]|jgi:segregation and condensation protein A|nr:segregation/condensation protein A [Candidatus Nanoarchaeia archaeon]|tara:strand:+ start:1060 stop:1770 length:711 start_codon:yes stop_codon:yes gene_type:complete